MHSQNEKKKSLLEREPTVFLLMRMWVYGREERRTITLFFVLFTLSNLAVLLGPLVIAHFLNVIQDDGVTRDNVWYLIFVISGTLGVTFLFWSLHGPGRVLERKVAFIVQWNYKQYLMENILSLKLAWHSDRDSGDTIDKVNKATKALFEFSQHTFMIFSVVVRLIGSCAALAFFHLYIGLGVFVYMIVVFYILFLFDRRLIPQYKELNEYDNKISAKIFDSLSNITSVIILKIQKSVLRDIVSSIRRPYHLFVRNAKLNESKWFTASVFSSLATLIPVAFYLFAQLDAGTVIEIGTITALILYLQQLTDTFYYFGGYYEDLIRQKTDVLNIEEIEEDFDIATEVRGRKKTFKKLSLENVTFSYDTAEGVAQIDDVSLDVKAGEKIAVIGASGSGKTTFLKVLHGLYPDVSGTLTIDGKRTYDNIPEVNLGTTLVPQEPELFSATIKENITLATDCTKKNLQEVLDMAKFSDVVDELPHGLESKIHEKGVNLSGGQKQRLALSRALLFARKKQVILLDESTSSVDPVNEVKIYKNIFRAFKRQTIIASIHKMNLLQYFDRIIIFHKGKVVGDGTFKDLKKDNKAFQKMWKEYSEG